MKPALFLALALSASAQSLVWDPNSEPDLAGYRVYVFGPTNLMATVPAPATNYPLAWLPLGEYQFLLTAFNSSGESEPSGPLTWTNSPPILSVILHLQSGATLGQWTNLLSVTNSQPINGQSFYRGVLEIKP